MTKLANILILALWITAMVTPILSFDDGGCDMVCCEIAATSCPMEAGGACSTGKTTMPVQQIPGTLAQTPSNKVILAEVSALPNAIAIELVSPATPILSANSKLAASCTVPLLI